MTTTISIQAHCSNDIEVQVKMNNTLIARLNDKEEFSTYVYGTQVLTVQETPKENK